MRAGLGRSALILVLLFHAVCAQSAEQEQGRFGTQAESLVFPSVARVVVGFLITVAIAAGAVLMLRRASPLLASRVTPSTNIRPLGRVTLSRTLTVHLVEMDGIRVVMVEGRGAVGMTVLPADSQSHSTKRDSNKPDSNEPGSDA